MNETTTNKLVVTLPSDTQIQMTRTFDAPRDLVFKAMTSPEFIPRWWGSRTSTTRIDVYDFRPGGKYRFVSTEQNGDEYVFYGDILEIDPPSRFVQTFVFEPMPDMVSTDHLTLTEQGNKTIAVVLSNLTSKEQRDAMIETGMETGAAESYDRLEELLATLNQVA